MNPHCSFVNIACNAVLAAIGIGYLFFAYILTVHHFPYKSLCPFYLITSIHCPLCGMTHAFGELINGNLAKAVAYNALVLPLFVLWMGYTLSATFNVARDLKRYSDIKPSVEDFSP